MMRPSAVGSRRSSAGGRRSSASGRPSLAPMRVKNDNASNIGRGARSSVGGPPLYGGTTGSSSRKRPVPRFRGGGPTTSTRRTSASSIRGNFGYDVIKETRPIKDKSFMQREIQDILLFLQQYEFPHPVSGKTLMNPTTKDFLRIFEFIYSFILPNYKMPAKHEEEIPQVLRNLKYPFVLSKTAMFSLGSPHTWPHILAALHWMTEIVKYALMVDIGQILFSPEPESEDGELQYQDTNCPMFFEFVEKTYAEFLAGADSFDDLEREMADTLKRKTLGIAGDLASLELEERRLTNELQQLEQEPNRLASSMERLQALQMDNEKLGKFMKELENHKNGQLQKLQDVDLQVQQKDLELAQLEQENRRLEQHLATQELSAVDVQRLQTEARSLNAAIDQVEREHQALDKEIWDEERKIAKVQEQLERKVAEYNSMARKLRLIPADAENARGMDFELRLTFGNPASMEVFTRTIKPALQQLKREASERIHEINNQKLLEEERLDELTETVENKEAQVAKLEATVQKLEADITDFKEKSKRECDMLAEKAQQQEIQLKMFIAQGDGDVEKARAQRDAMKESNEKRTAVMSREKAEYEQFVLKACTMVVEHKIMMQEHFHNLAKKGKDYLEVIRSLKVPTADMEG